MNQSTSIQTRTKEEKEALYVEWESSGLSKKDFCLQKSINYQTFIWWFASRKKKQRKGSFVPVVVSNPQQPLQIEIQLSNSRKITLNGLVSAEILQAILKC